MIYHLTDDQEADLDELYSIVAALYDVSNKAMFYNQLLDAGTALNKICTKMAVDL